MTKVQIFKKIEKDCDPKFCLIFENYSRFLGYKSENLLYFPKIPVGFY